MYTVEYTHCSNIKVMYKEAIEGLRALTLSESNYDEVKVLINQFGPFGLIDMPLNPGVNLIRARPHRNDVEEHFTTRAELSYKPQEFNTTYQRASTPNRTMFYAGVIPDEIHDGENVNGRAVATLESSSLMRGKQTDGEQIVTFSRWMVTKPISLIGICYREDLIGRTQHGRNMYDIYMEGLSGESEEMIAKSIAITQFLADEFAKPHIGTDRDYLISAVFSEMVVNKGKAGIYYPSVRTEGQGFNVAISPEYADSCLKLVAAGECTIYRKGMRTIVDNDTVCLIEDDSKPFQSTPVSDDLHIGRARAYEHLNVL